MAQDNSGARLVSSIKSTTAIIGAGCALVVAAILGLGQVDDALAKCKPGGILSRWGLCTAVSTPVPAPAHAPTPVPAPAAAPAPPPASSVEGQNVRYPRQGLPAFSVDVPLGWRASVNADGSLTIQPDQFVRAQIVVLHMLSAPAEVENRSSAEIADMLLARLKSFRTFTKREPGLIAGRSGETFFASSVDQSTPIELALTLVRLDPKHVAALVAVFSKDLTEFEKAGLLTIISRVQLQAAK